MKKLFEIIEVALLSNHPTEIVDAYLATSFPLSPGNEVEGLTQRQIISELIYRLIGLAYLERGKLEEAHKLFCRQNFADFHYYAKFAKCLASQQEKGIIESEVYCFGKIDTKASESDCETLDGVHPL